MTARRSLTRPASCPPRIFILLIPLYIRTYARAQWRVTVVVGCPAALFPILWDPDERRALSVSFGLIRVDCARSDHCVVFFFFGVGRSTISALTRAPGTAVTLGDRQVQHRPLFPFGVTIWEIIKLPRTGSYYTTSLGGPANAYKADMSRLPLRIYQSPPAQRQFFFANLVLLFRRTVGIGL